MKCESGALEDCGRTLTGRWQESERTVILVPFLCPLNTLLLLRPWRSDTKEMEPVVGLEPTTDGLQNRCSTTELNWLRSLNHQLALKISPALERFQTQFGAPVSGRSYGSEKHP